MIIALKELNQVFVWSFKSKKLSCLPLINKHLTLYNPLKYGLYSGLMRRTKQDEFV